MAASATGTGLEESIVLQDDDLVVRRGIEAASGARVLLVSPQSDPPAQRTIARLSHEFALRDELDAAWAARPLAFARDRRRQVLLRNDPGGEPLESSLVGPLPVGRLLDLAIALAAAVGHLHARGMVHRDLKPANVIVDGDRVWLTGFGRASRNLREQPGAPAGEVIEGTFAYMAPEQTGRMNRSVDTRSDLYSLGVVLYRMLTGTLPFEASEPLDWVYSHIARRPPPPAERHPAAPAPLAALVLKLLEKNPEERYQTAAGVESDLVAMRAHWQADGVLQSFALGTNDASARLLVPERLYGRERECVQLRQAFGRVIHGGAHELVLVSGYSGMGKSALVRELMRDIEAQPVRFIAGKFDQYKRDVPFATIAQAFGGLVRQVLREDEASIARWRAAIEEAAGRHGQLLFDLVPELEWLIGPQPPTLEVGPAEARNRFQATVRRFVAACATAEHPLVLFLDDMQWIDPASLALLEHLVTQGDAHHLLIVGAYRDNEVGAAHRLALALDRIDRGEAAVTRIVLRPLEAEDVGQLVADTLCTGTTPARPLADLVYHRAGGNPFFVIQLLTTLAEDRLLWFDAAAGAWRWEAARVAGLGYTDNVVDLMLVRLQRLPPPTLEALERLACLGPAATRATLALACDTDEDSLDSALQDALRAGVLATTADGWRFVHDRVQEAAYSLVSAQSRPALHLRIGRLLRERLPPAVAEARLFELVDHFQRAGDLVRDPAERDAVAALMIAAGRKAKAAIAYAAARAYFGRAQALGPPDAWRTRYAATLALQLERAECEFLAGEPADADVLFDGALAAGANDLDRARVLGLRMRCLQSAGRLAEALDCGLRALALFGCAFPHDDAELPAATQREQDQFWQGVGARRIADLADLPVASDPQALATMALLADAGTCAYNARPLLTPLIYCRALNLALAAGNSPSTCMTYISYGSYSVARGDLAAAFEFAELGLQLNDRFGDARLRGTLLYVHGAHVNLWRKPLGDSVPILEQGFLACQDVGNVVFAAFNAALLVSVVLESGELLEDAARVARRYAAFAREYRNESIHGWLRICEQLIACLEGRTLAPDTLDDEGFSESACLALFQRGRFHTGIAHLHLNRALAGLFQRREATALAAAEDCEATVRAVRSMPLEATHHFVHGLLLAAAAAADAGKRAGILERVDAKIAMLEFWAGHCADNHAHRLALLRAERARAAGDDLRAMHAYDAAIAAARTYGYVQYEGLASELASEFYLSRGLMRPSEAYLVDARAAYRRWGANGLVARLDREHPGLASSGRAHAQPGRETTVEQLDLVSVVKASQAVSNDILLDSLVQTLLRIAMEHAGADRGLLLLPGADGHRIVAEALVDAGGTHVRTRDAPPGSDDLAESVLAYVVRTREKVLIDTARGPNPFAADLHFVRRPPQSLLCLPLLKQGALVGVLYLENGLAPGAFSDRTAVLELLATQAAISLENAGLVANLQREQAAIRELNAGLEKRVADRTAALDHALREQQAILDNALTGIAFIRDRVVLRCNEGFESLFGFAPGTLAGRSTRTLYASDEDYESIERDFYPAIRRNAGVFEDRLMYRQDGQWIWTTSPAKLVDPADPSRGLVWVLQDITARKQAEQALAEQSAAFERLAREDGLTGLSNRRHFDGCARAAFAQCRERGEPVCAALIDLDHFKRINDSCSHAVGDAVLQQAAALIREHLPPPAITGRYGGEEFVALFPGLQTAEARALCEQLRGALQAQDFDAVHPGLRVTLSAGVAAGGDTLERLLGEADQRLYEAKAAGRNRIG